MLKLKCKKKCIAAKQEKSDTHLICNGRDGVINMPAAASLPNKKADLGRYFKSEQQ